jgi:two-component system phosphate regulon sensor histidine kinase PhoR
MEAFLEILLFIAVLFFLSKRRENIIQTRAIHELLDEMLAGRRPHTFILHGNAEFSRIGLSLETLANQQASLQRQISREEFNLQTILSSMEEGVMVVDTERCVRLVNHSFMDLFEIKSNPLGHSVLYVLRSAPIEDLVRDALTAELATSREVILTTSAKHLAVSAAPVRDEKGVILGVAAIFHDITRLKQLEQVRKEFVANVSHELRTPLSIFQGYVEMMLEDADMPKDELVHSLQVLARHSNRLNALVEDLLTLARLESRSDDLKLAPVNLAEFFGALEEDWHLKFNEKKVNLIFDLQPDLPNILGDTFRLEQVFYNLLDNALKYTAANGQVTLKAVRTETPSVEFSHDSTSATGVVMHTEAAALASNVEISVADTGTGIPPNDLPHIFERFYRADKARSRSLGGTGLGLSIVKHIIQLHGGSVSAESLMGKGTTIVLRIPVAQLFAV